MSARKFVNFFQRGWILIPRLAYAPFGAQRFLMFDQAAYVGVKRPLSVWPCVEQAALCRSARRQPQDLVWPKRRLAPRAMVIVPQSHLQR